jgi:hypothetical protein
MIGIIYTIPLNGELYVGSTFDKVERNTIHKSISKSSECKLYVAIRANGGIFEMITHHEYICNSRDELRQEEQRTMNLLKPTLNMLRAYNSDEYKKRLIKDYYKNKIQPQILANIEKRKEDIMEIEEYYEKYIQLHTIVEKKTDIVIAKAEYDKIYNKKNAIEIAKKDKIWEQKNSEKRAEQKSRKYLCICGKNIAHGGKSSHEKTLFHKRFIKENNII